MSTAGDFGREGVFTLFAMVHTMSLPGPEGPRATRPWDGSAGAEGVFSYVSKPCSGEAPVNNVSSDLPLLGGSVAGGRAPASTRSHPFSFEVGRREGRLVLAGAIRLTVCAAGPGPTPEEDPVADDRRDRIDVTWKAQVHDHTPDLVSWQGAFELAGGSGAYRDLRGEGRIGGYFFSFRSDPEARGTLLDGQYAMIGRYRVREGEGPASRPA